MLQLNDRNSFDEQIQYLETRVFWLESMVVGQFAALAICFWQVVPMMFVLLIVLLPVLVFVHRFIPSVARWAGRMLSRVVNVLG
ncbi:MAG: hypothetical protein NT013_18015 [Planctomycetia bacterium]|nr:hypothetical protein [Planctomycetia bacterium]